MESCVAYVVNQSNTEISDDLGYRWEAGELTDWEVLSELTGVRIPILKNVLSELTAEEYETHHCWVDAGQTFDWLLGGDIPYYVEKEYYKL